MKMTVRQQKIHEQALGWLRMRKRSESGLLANLIENQKEKVYGCFGKTSVFEYLVDVLGLSEPVANSFNTVFRKSMEVPELARAIREDKLSVCKASRIVSSLNESNAEELVKFAVENSWRAIEVEMARRNPQRAGREKIKPINEQLVEVKLYMTPEEADQLRRGQDLLSSKRRKPVTLSEAAAQSFKELVTRHDPVQKAERASLRKQKKKSVRTDSGQRAPLTAEQHHAVNARDKGRCTFVDKQGNRCKNERWLDKHHIIPVSEGGTNEPQNLTTLCWFHHDLVHQLSLPLDGQVQWLRDRGRPYFSARALAPCQPKPCQAEGDLTPIS